ncbi:MAG: acyl-CoA thioesterase [Chitinophagales bacterium]|nr:acyl-CoA thioesterase [Chitinophagales bacterium]
MSTQEIIYKYPLEIPVHWGDQDALGHVNNVMFIRYFESARVHMLEVGGIWDKYRDAGLFVVLAKIECNFLKSIHYPETIIAQCGLVKVGNSSVTVEHQIIIKSTGEIAATGQGIMVCADPITQKSVKIPEHLKQLLIQELS